MEIKKHTLTKRMIKLGIITVLLAIFTPTAFAATCGDLMNPEFTKDNIITIIEEQIGNAGQSFGEDVEVINCIRKSSPDPNDSKKIVSEYLEIGDTSSCTDENVTCNRIQALIAKSGLALLFGYIGLIYRWSAGVVGIVAVVYLVWGGIMITTSGDDTNAVEEAKRKIIQSLTGLVLLFLSAIILYTINPNFFTL